MLLKVVIKSTYIQKIHKAETTQRDQKQPKNSPKTSPNLGFCSIK